MTPAFDWYDANSETISARYEEVPADVVHGWLADLLPVDPGSILDVGAGSGRDAAWLATKGHDVIAVEPSANMRMQAARLHPEAKIHWIVDSLPALTEVTRTGLSFDLILLSAVWMHVPPSDRPRAFRKLINLLKAGGLIAITLRHGAPDAEREMHPVSVPEIEALARVHGAFIERRVEARDQLGRTDVCWTQLAIRLPDAGVGALPLLRHIILNDDKVSTYKLALLRTLCRAADGAAGFARDHNDELVAVPLGLIALIWIRLFKPLLRSALPQTPSNVGYKGLSFVRDAFKKLTDVSSLDFRVGMAFTGDLAVALHQCLKDAANTISKMPATYMKYPKGGRILEIDRSARPARPTRILLDQAYLSSFGHVLIPRHLWRAIQHLDAWIEPAIVAEWTRLIKFYASRQGARVDENKIAAAMTWEEPKRDVRMASERAIKLAETDRLFCVWSGKRLSRDTVDIDHCFPWSVWPCSDLWNLMPAHRNVNQKEKRSRLPSARLLVTSSDRIMTWWNAAYLQAHSSTEERFWLEASASLPSIEAESNSLHNVVDAVVLQQIKLKNDQQVPEWVGGVHAAITEPSTRLSRALPRSAADSGDVTHPHTRQA